MYCITLQKRGACARTILATFENAADALDAAAMQCPAELMEYFTPGDAVLTMRGKIIRAESITDAEVARGWTISRPKLLTQSSER